MSEPRDLVMAGCKILTAVALLGALVWAITAVLTEARTRRMIELQKGIIEYKHPDPRKRKALSEQEKRAARSTPNARLITAFGVNNIFTTMDTGRATEFRTQAINKLKTALDIIDGPEDREANWKPLIEDIKQTTEAEFTGKQTSINLTEVIQYITLKVSLKYLFELDEGSVNNKTAIAKIAKEINRLWVGSKQTGAGTRSWADETDLHQEVKKITGLDPTDDEHNPMNFILPAYETMWRAVHRGILEIYFRQAPDALHWKYLLLKFLHHPTKLTFHTENEPLILSPRDVIKEIVRLYPPTRRIYRRFPGESEDTKADLEKCHRNKLLATTEPESFIPERWIGIRQSAVKGKHPKRFEESRGFFPFALTCPAGQHVTQAFGFKMIALLVCAIGEAFEGLEGDWKLMAGDRDELPALGTALKSDREDYLTLVYKKVDTRKRAATHVAKGGSGA